MLIYSWSVSTDYYNYLFLGVEDIDKNRGLLVWTEFKKQISTKAWRSNCILWNYQFHEMFCFQKIVLKASVINAWTKKKTKKKKTAVHWLYLRYWVIYDKTT